MSERIAALETQCRYYYNMAAERQREVLKLRIEILDLRAGRLTQSDEDRDLIQRYGKGSTHV